MALSSKTYLRLLILKLLSEEQMWGYRLCQALQERTRGHLQPKAGTIYPLLRDLEQKELVVGEWRPSADGPQRKCYQLTPQGREALTAFTRLWTEEKAPREETLVVGSPEYLQHYGYDYG